MHPSENSARLALVAVLVVAGCTEPLPVEPENEIPAPAVTERCSDDGAGFVRGQLHGAIDMPLDWQNDGLHCTGMPRPGESGARLRFARKLPPHDSELVLIIGVDALSAGSTGNGFEATVTVIDERDSAFYSNQGVNNCWVDVSDHRLDDSGEAFIRGVLYCSGALARQQGDGSVTPGEIRFAGRMDWTPPQTGLGDVES